MDAIVFTSATGFTEKYARLLGQKTGLPVHNLSGAQKALTPGAKIIYLGWLSAGSLKGYKKAAKRFNIQALCAVGMSDPSAELEAQIKKKYGLTCPVHVLQGGYAPDRLKGLNKLAMKAFTKALIGQLEKKASLTPQEQVQLSMLKHGADLVSPESLNPLVSWLKNAK